MEQIIKKLIKRAHVIKELRDRFDYTNVDDKDYDQLINVLTHFRAMDINHDTPADKWF